MQLAGRMGATLKWKGHATEIAGGKSNSQGCCRQNKGFTEQCSVRRTGVELAQLAAHVKRGVGKGNPSEDPKGFPKSNEAT